LHLDYFLDSKNGVVTFGGFQSLASVTKDFVEEIFGAGLAIGAGDADDGEVGVVEYLTTTILDRKKMSSDFVGFDDRQREN